MFPNFLKVIHAHHLQLTQGKKGDNEEAGAEHGLTVEVATPPQPGQRAHVWLAPRSSPKSCGDTKVNQTPVMPHDRMAVLPTVT